jgi:hypothetical protein
VAGSSPCCRPRPDEVRRGGLSGAEGDGEALLVHPVRRARGRRAHRAGVDRDAARERAPRTGVERDHHRPVVVSHLRGAVRRDLEALEVVEAEGGAPRGPAHQVDRLVEGEAGGVAPDVDADGGEVGHADERAPRGDDDRLLRVDIALDASSRRLLGIAHRPAVDVGADHRGRLLGREGRERDVVARGAVPRRAGRVERRAVGQHEVVAGRRDDEGALVEAQVDGGGTEAADAEEVGRGRGPIQQRQRPERDGSLGSRVPVQVLHHVAPGARGRGQPLVGGREGGEHHVSARGVPGGRGGDDGLPVEGEDREAVRDDGGRRDLLVEGERDRRDPAEDVDVAVTSSGLPVASVTPMRARPAPRSSVSQSRDLVMNSAIWALVTGAAGS